MGSQTAEFIKLIDNSIGFAEKRLSTESDPAIAKSIANVIRVLRSTKDDALRGSLSSSQGIATLGLTREALDWGEPPASPLLEWLRAVDRYYRDHVRS
jgi:hypothetical protein